MTTFFSTEAISEVTPEDLSRLREAAASSPLKRARLCLHHDHQDQVQEMVIAFCRSSYVPPHRHLDKSEAFHVIEGELTVLIFDDDGAVTRRIEMAPVTNGFTFLYRLSSPLWHTVVPRSDVAVIHEITAGPFIEGGMLTPHWAPDATDPVAAQQFLRQALSTRDPTR